MQTGYVVDMEILVVMLQLCVFICGFKDASICLCAGFSFRNYFWFSLNIWEYLNEVTPNMSANCCVWILYGYSASSASIIFLHSVLKNKDLKSDITFPSDTHGLQKHHRYVCLTYVGRLRVDLRSAFSVSTCSFSWSFFRNLTVATVVSHVLGNHGACCHTSLLPP